MTNPSQTATLETEICGQRLSTAHAANEPRRRSERLSRPTAAPVSRGNVLLFCGGGNHVNSNRDALGGASHSLRAWRMSRIDPERTVLSGVAPSCRFFPCAGDINSGHLSATLHFVGNDMLQWSSRHLPFPIAVVGATFTTEPLVNFRRRGCRIASRREMRPWAACHRSSAACLAHFSSQARTRTPRTTPAAICTTSINVARAMWEPLACELLAVCLLERR